MRHLRLPIDAGSTLCGSCQYLEQRTVGGIKPRWRCVMLQKLTDELRDDVDGPLRSAKCLALEVD